MQPFDRYELDAWRRTEQLRERDEIRLARQLATGSVVSTSTTSHIESLRARIRAALAWELRHLHLGHLHR